MGEDELFSMDNILSGDEAAALFDVDSQDTDNTNTVEESQEKDEAPEEQTEETNKTKNIAEVLNTENLFTEDEPESVGNGTNKGTGDTASNKAANSQKNPNFYASITDALVEAGVLPDLSEEDINSIESPEDFTAVIEKQILSLLNERLKRIDEALSNNVQPSVIREYENTLGFLDQITEEVLTEESDRGEDIRRRLLTLDLLNKSFSLEKATKMVDRIFASGEDVDEARVALEENRKYFLEKYNGILLEARIKEDKAKALDREMVSKLKDSIMNEKEAFGNYTISKQIRQKAYDNIMKPIYKDTQTGTTYTAIQKYKMENENEFIKNVGLLFTLTDGFKDLTKLSEPIAKKLVRSKLRDLENTIRSSKAAGNGRLEYVGTNTNSSSGNIFDLGFTLDI